MYKLLLIPKQATAPSSPATSSGTNTPSISGQGQSQIALSAPVSDNVEVERVSAYASTSNYTPSNQTIVKQIPNVNKTASNNTTPESSSTANATSPTPAVNASANHTTTKEQQSANTQEYGFAGKFGGEGFHNREINYPNFIALDPSGNIYITQGNRDSGNRDCESSANRDSKGWKYYENQKALKPRTCLKC